MEELKFNVTCKELDGAVSSSQVTFTDDNQVDAENSKYGPIVHVSEIESEGILAGWSPMANGQGGTIWSPKADLRDGKVPSSQLPSYVSNVVEVATYQDLPAQGASDTIYVTTADGKSYRWSGTQYIEVDDAQKYYSVPIQNMSTMGELRAYIDGINQQGMHCFFDFSAYVDKAYVCTVLMFTENNVDYCLIFDLINGRTFINYAGYQSNETIQHYVSANEDNLIRAIKVTDANTTMADVNAILASVNDIGHHVMFDVSALNAGAYLCTIFIGSGNVQIFDIVKGYNCNIAYDGAQLLTAALALLHPITSEVEAAIAEHDDNFADTYDATATYAVGDLVIHDHRLYKCKTAISVAEAWDATHWDELNIFDASNDRYFRVIYNDEVDYNNLTDEQIELFTRGCIVRHRTAPESKLFLGASTWAPYDSNLNALRRGTVYRRPGNGCFALANYELNPSTKKLTIGQNFMYSDFANNSLNFSGIGGGVLLSLTGAAVTQRCHISSPNLNGKAWPSYPTDLTKQYALEQNVSTGNLGWNEKKYGPSQTNAALTELTYEKISVISLTADRTFTLKAAQADCIPEYKALVTNSGSSVITLTFTGVGTIHTNDPNIVCVSATNSTATIPAGVKVEVSIFDGDAIVYNKNAISFATTQEVEALF